MPKTITVPAPEDTVYYPYNIDTLVPVIDILNAVGAVFIVVPQQLEIAMSRPTLVRLEEVIEWRLSNYGPN